MAVVVVPCSPRDDRQMLLWNQLNGICQLVAWLVTKRWIEIDRLVGWLADMMIGGWWLNPAGMNWTGLLLRR